MNPQQRKPFSSNEILSRFALIHGLRNFDRYNTTINTPPPWVSWLTLFTMRQFVLHITSEHYKSFLLRNCRGSVSANRQSPNKPAPPETISMISGFRREVAEYCALLDYYAASSGNFVPTFRDNDQSHPHS